MTYIVKNQHFEGPLDLLLSLIEDQKLDITQVSLAEITGDYMDYVRAQEQITLANLAAFLNVAAKLILIKSRALLPLLQFDDDEEVDMMELERQLMALKVIKDVIPAFALLYDTRTPQYARVGFWGVQVQFVPQDGLHARDLESAFRKALGAIPRLDRIEEKIISDVISLERRITQVQEAVRQRAEVAFSELIAESSSPQEIVVSFLALLELVKQKLLVAQQSGVFEDIHMKKFEITL